MDSSTISTGSRWSLGRIAVVGVVGGVVGGLLLALAVTLYGAFSDTRAFWDAPAAVWSWVFGAEHFTQNDPGAHVWPVILGFGALMANSIVVGLVFTALMAFVPRRDDVIPVAAGAALGVGVWALMRYAILPINDEEVLFSTGVVAPAWVWWIASAGFGVALGVVFDLARHLAPGRLVPTLTHLPFRRELGRAA